MDFEKAIVLLEDKPEFDVIIDTLSEMKENCIKDLSNIDNAQNPQLLAYLAGSISVLDIFLSSIDETKSKRANHPWNKDPS